MFYIIFKYICRLVFSIFFLKVEGKHNIPKNTNYIVVANHASFLDPLVICAVFPKRVYFIAARWLYKVPLVKWVIRLTHCVPIGGNATSQAMKLLESNRIVGIFPEGKVSRDGNLNPFRRGVIVMALRTGKPILPCFIEGAYQILPLHRYIPRWHFLKVKIGKPLYFLKEENSYINDILIQKEMVRLRKVMEYLRDL